jgi:hypothetical protein
MLERSILITGLVVSVVAGVAAYRTSGPYGQAGLEDPRVRRFFDAAGRIRMLVYDADGDGRFDTWSYMDGQRLLRIEIDEDDDGLIDRWEYFAPDGSVERVGISTTHDGRPDRWEDRKPDEAAAPAVADEVTADRKPAMLDGKPLLLDGKPVMLERKP